MSARRGEFLKQAKTAGTGETSMKEIERKKNGQASHRARWGKGDGENSQRET